MDHAGGDFAHACGAKLPGTAPLKSAFLSMRDLPFPYVTILTGVPGNKRNICSVAEAAEWLVMYWPIKEGKKLIEARQACRDALAGRITCTKARSAFIEAAREADIYIDHKRL